MLISPPLLADGTHILLTESLYTTPRWVISRSEEHTSELQSQSNLVCRLLLEKKKNLKQMLSDFIYNRGNHDITICIVHIMSSDQSRYRHDIQTNLHTLTPAVTVNVAILVINH